ncbi:hypothetical protein EFM06_06690 [Lactobacillus helveticus]|nr:hypothetical protein [Lactobacillus helveticus]MCT0165255.1 hypothetical protein [Lactobacillus helveticus]MCT0191888.1 hypothetical protein [Lactobacillus helveticus]MCT0197412.1 hypothetical protein [Lactobacillus helveticus]
MSIYRIASGVGFVSGNGHHFISTKDNNFELNISEEQAQQIRRMLHEIRLGNNLDDNSQIIKFFLKAKIIEKISEPLKKEKEKISILSQDSNVFPKGRIGLENKKINFEKTTILSIYYFSDSGRLWLCSQPLPENSRKSIESISLTKEMQSYLLLGIQKNFSLVKEIEKNKFGILSLDILDFRHRSELFSTQLLDLESYYLLQREFLKTTVLSSNFLPFKKIRFRTVDQKEYVFYAPNLNIAKLLYLYNRLSRNQFKVSTINKLIIEEVGKLNGLTTEAFRILKQICRVKSASTLDSFLDLSQKLLEMEKY